MQTKITYVIIFLFAFILTTGGVVLVNQKFENIFKFDFSPRSEVLADNKSDSTKAPIDTSGLKNEWAEKVKQNVTDSLSQVAGSDKIIGKTADKTQAIIDERNRQLDSLNKVKKELALYQAKLKTTSKEVQGISADMKTKQDSAYIKWRDEMVKTYELMDTRMAAKIIQKLNDNLAKDILFSMKKKKRAQILAEFSPDTAIRLTRMQ